MKPCPQRKTREDILEHFDEYARGEGRLARQAMQNLDIETFEAAAMFWGGGYDPVSERLRQGPFEIVVPRAIEAAERLQAAIYAAGRAIDRTRAARP
jgi:hypothetical protein